MKWWPSCNRRGTELRRAMIKSVLSWLYLRQDTLAGAKSALAHAQQVMNSQRVTIEGLRKLNEILLRRIEYHTKGDE